MRFKLILSVNKEVFGNLLPINYQYEQSATIYKILSRASKEYSEWLHKNGYQIEGGKKFKLFTFSPLKIEKRKILTDSERIAILCDKVEWQISFFPEKSTEKFIQSLLNNQIFEIGDKKSVVQFHIQHIELLPPPLITESMTFNTMSPICIRQKRENGTTEYLSPDDPRSKVAILSGLLSRYESFYGRPYHKSVDFRFVPFGNIKKKLVTIKTGTASQTRVVGYKCKFNMQAPVELMQIAYESGVGEECAQGFGCIKNIVE
ncbi:MAG: CRISPR-associated endoribonuclease Cas6 [Bacteroidales bacterium]